MGAFPEICLDQIPVVDIRPGSEWRKKQDEIASTQYGIVSFPRSGHNWLSRMLSEIIRLHNGYDEPACLGRSGGMGAYIALRAQPASSVEYLSGFYDPFPVVYGSHGSVMHWGHEPNTQLYLWRGFRAVWKSTKKASSESPVAAWWGKNLLDCFWKWASHRWTYRNTPLKVRYEELQENTEGVLRRIVEHMGVFDVSDEIFAKAVKAGSRENMLREQDLYGSPNFFQTINK